MPDVVIIGDTFRSPELRNEIPLAVPDPFVYLERDGDRHVYVGSMEASRIRGLGLDLTVHTLEEIGIDELYEQGFDYHTIRLEWVARSCVHAGLKRAVVPHTFPAGHLDRIRREGIELTVDQPTFDARRRVKTAPQLDGIRRAQRAAEAGLRTGIALLRSASDRQRHPVARRRGAHGRARQAGDGHHVRRARLHGRGVRRRTGTAGRSRARHGPRADSLPACPSSSTSGRGTTRPPALPT